MIWVDFQADVVYRQYARRLIQPSLVVPRADEDGPGPLGRGAIVYLALDPSDFRTWRAIRGQRVYAFTILGIFRVSGRTLHELASVYEIFAGFGRTLAWYPGQSPSTHLDDCRRVE